MKKLPILLVSAFLLVSCAESLALLGPATSISNGNIVNSSLKSAVSFGVKKQTGKTPMQHVLAYAKEVNPNKKKEKCISFIEKTNSEACMIAKKQISLVQSAVSKKISKAYAKLFWKYFKRSWKPTIAFNLSTYLSKNNWYTWWIINKFQYIANKLEK